MPFGRIAKRTDYKNMKSYIFPLAALAFFLNSCIEETVNPINNSCPALMCTEEFRSITVRIKTISGDTISLKEFSSKDLKTGKLIDNSNYKDLGDVSGSYVVVTDAYTRNLSGTGDTLLVKAISSSNVVKTAKFVVSGGKCACHIEKISGPEEIIF